MRFDADCERFKAQLQHFCFFYGFIPRRLGVHLAHDPNRAHSYLKGETVPRIETRQALRQFMRRYRKSVLV